MSKYKSNFDKSYWAGIILGSLGFLASLIWEDLADIYSQNEEQQAIANVNGIEISHNNYLSQLSSLAEDKRNELTTEDSSYVLQRIIEEELLVQRGLEVRLNETDRQTRAAIIASMISMITADIKSYQPSDEELLEFYQLKKDYFKTTPRLRVIKLNTEGDDNSSASERAKKVQSQLSSGSSLDKILNSKVTLDRYLPNSFLPLQKLREYIGPTQSKQLFSQMIGSTAVIHNPNGTSSVLYLQDKQAGKVRPFEQIKSVVESEYSRSKADEALREYLDWLTSRAEISIAPSPELEALNL